MKLKNRLVLSIANLRINIEGRDSGLNLAAPFIYDKFLVEDTRNSPLNQLGNKALSISITQNTCIPDGNLGIPLCQTEIWALWKTVDGKLIFHSPRQFPEKWVLIDPTFTQGELIGDFSNLEGKPFYPLSSIDIRIMVNWLALFGYLVLHAAGAAYHGEGYCFVGRSGIGKSTLAEKLMEDADIEILGEDQVILRYLDGEFWIFGTPWHERDKMCSPNGVPLRKVFFLEREGKLGVTEIPSAKAMEFLLQTAFIPYYLSEKMPLILERLALLCEKVSLHQYHYELGSDILADL